MADDQKKCVLSSGFKCLVRALLCLLVLVVPSVSSQPIFKQLSLSSSAHCYHGDSDPAGFAVDNNTVYNVLGDTVPKGGSHAFQECRMMFQSVYPDGRVCIKQRKVDFCHRCHVRLELYNGWMGLDASNPAKKLDCDTPLASVEWCTSGRNLTIKMAQIGKKPTLEDTTIDILVYDMQSVHRAASLDYTPSCLSKFEMDGSQVVVTNINPSGHVRMQPFSECALTFEYKGRDKNRTMCMIFEAVQELNHGCSKLNYTLKVFSFFGSRSTRTEYKELSTTRSCANPLPRQWCSNSTKISLELHRSADTGTTENAVVFYAMVVDHDGELDTLPTLTLPVVKAHQASSSTVLVICLSVAACLCILVVCTVIFWRRRRYRFLQRGGTGSMKDTRHLPTSMMDSNSNSYHGDRKNDTSEGHNPLLSQLSASKHQNSTLNPPPPSKPCPPPPAPSRDRAGSRQIQVMLPPFFNGQVEVQSA